MTEPHETFTWYGTKPFNEMRVFLNIHKNKSCYISRRNKRIAIRRALQILGALAIVWGLVWLTL